jgi:two-component system sensor histidine kinase VicK
MVTVMAIVGLVLINNVFSFYTEAFVSQMDAYLGGDVTADSNAPDTANDVALKRELIRAMETSPETPESAYTEIQKERLIAYSNSLGINNYRNFYILDMNGNFITGSNEELGRNLINTKNRISAMNKKDGKTQILGTNYTDYAVYLRNESSGRECIIYIKDTQEEMRQLSWESFSIILQTVFFGLIIAFILSFFLANTITSPIQSLTKGAQMVTVGEFTEEIDIQAKDEIGILTATFNNMKQVLKNTLDEVSGERQKLTTILSYLKDAVVAFSANGKIIHINKAAYELFMNTEDINTDTTMEQFMVILGIDLTHGDATHGDATQNNTSESNDEKSYIFNEVKYRNKTLSVNISLLRYMEENNTYNGYIMVLNDITIRYELEKARREFVANVSHELRTPLTVIKSSIESLQLYPDMEPQFRDTFIKNALEECDRMLVIIGDLLTLSRLDNSKTAWKLSTFDTNEFLKHICDIMQSDASDHNHKLIYNENKRLPSITADKARIQQVITNIISNSIKYTPDKGTISVRTTVDGADKINIIVKDSGIGIPDEDLPRIFDRFYRVEKSRTQNTGGTGLGLAIAKEIIEAHGGNIYVNSIVGKGTEVIIQLFVTAKIECGEKCGEKIS